MNISRQDESSCTVLTLTGRLDASQAPVLDRAFQATYDAGVRNFVWDCSGLDYLGSAGLRSFLQAMKKLKAGGGQLVIAGAPGPILDVFDIAGFKSLLALSPSRAEAVGRF